MFEKSLYDLIKGIRSHKGNEKQYIQKVLKECRAEVRSQDMDVKATALLKLVYLEMVGHDMSWASFHVLEVMSSPKYHQKRVGYLGAVQSFRTDTEVLMLATNLLKKDLSATSPIVMSLPIAALPHVITPSLALSTLADLLPRLGHSHANIRKKSLVTLYRLALVYPETLRAAWPKIKERLMDPDEDSSVTAAIVNVICELGWRRPHDFLPLAPRLFELLVDGNNNWMAIKLIKLFAILTPMEPRLTRKLLPPLTNIIRTTPAMSLLYECINGIIQGGILSDESSDTDEIATLCVSKLRGMITINGDPNLKYVALLAFNKIVLTHPHLVSEQEDVILDCIDNPDITIRIQALDLFQGMVSADNLTPIVSRLMKQLKLAAAHDGRDDSATVSIDSSYDSDGEPKPPTQASKPRSQSPPLPEDYRLDVVSRILQMSSKDNYANITDFDWYIDILTQLVRIMPVTTPSSEDESGLARGSTTSSVSKRIGNELRNVAVKVRAMRSTAVRAADDIIYQLLKITPVGHSVTSETLQAVVWILGEYCQLLQNADDTLSNLLQLIPRVGSVDVSIVMIQAIAKIFAAVAGDATEPWTAERKSRISLLMARILHVAEPFALHPNLEIQERASEFIELMKLTAEAAAGQPASTNEAPQDAPLLLTQAIPSLFNGWELNSVAAGAQYHVPLLDNLDLNAPIHRDLPGLLAQASFAKLGEEEIDAFEAYYNERPAPTSISSSTPALDRLVDPEESQSGGYQQQPDEDAYLDPDIVARRKAKRLEQNRDDPFYISNDANVAEQASIHNIIQSSNGDDVDIDSIPIMKLDLDQISVPKQAPQRQAPKPRQQITVAADEMLQSSGAGTPRYDSEGNAESSAKGKARKLKQGLLQVDSSTIGSFSLEGEPKHALGLQQQQEEEAEMQKAMHEVEKLRLEMQRANERIQVAQGVDTAGIIVKKKKKKKVVKDGEAADSTEIKVKKKKAKVGDDGEVVVTKKKKKRAPVTFDDEPKPLDS